jgi:hypothetical protein
MVQGSSFKGDKFGFQSCELKNFIRLGYIG